MNMLSTVYGGKKDIKKELKKSRDELSDWYYKEDKKYNRALAHFDEWYEEYAGASWDENHEAD
jgi:hypothetical protein